MPSRAYTETSIKKLVDLVDDDSHTEFIQNTSKNVHEESSTQRLHSPQGANSGNSPKRRMSSVLPLENQLINMIILEEDHLSDIAGLAFRSVSKASLNLRTSQVPVNVQSPEILTPQNKEEVSFS